jgi:hypothetical protein
MMASHSVQKPRFEIFSESKAVQIGRMVRREAGRWESGVEHYCTVQCGGSNEDARAVIKAIRKAVER